MQNLPQQIAAQKKALNELKVSLQIALQKPGLVIDRSAYPPLDRIEALLNLAKTAEEQKALVASINSEIAVEEEAIAQLEANLKDAQARLSPKIAEAQQLSLAIHTAYQAYIHAVEKIYRLSWDMAADRALVYGESATPLVVGLLDRDSLTNCLGFVASDDGEVKAALDLFKLGF